MNPRARLIAITGVIAAALVCAPGAGAATLTVNDTADDIGAGGTCTLREAVEAANVNADIGRGCVNAGAFGNDTVVLTDPAGYTLSRPRVPATPDDNLEGDLDVDSIAAGNSLEIVATVPTAIRGNGIDRVLDVQAGSELSVKGITIATGLAGSGGGVRVLAGGAELTLSDVTLTDNHANSSAGGAISSQGTTTLTNVTLSDNTAITDGGGITVSNAITTLNSVTLSDNTADVDGDGLGSGGGIDAFAGEVRMRDTLLAGNIDGNPVPSDTPDCVQAGGVITSLGNNLVGATTGCAYVAAAGDRTDQAPLLGPLAGNGGATATHALLAGSPAIDGGSAVCPATDQRGIGRPQGPGCDIGAFERQPDAVGDAGAVRPKPKCKKRKRKGKKRAATAKRKKCKKRKKRKGTGKRKRGR
jgi:CSLREA domain-containing protein